MQIKATAEQESYARLWVEGPAQLIIDPFPLFPFGCWDKCHSDLLTISSGLVQPVENESLNKPAVTVPRSASFLTSLPAMTNVGRLAGPSAKTKRVETQDVILQANRNQSCCVSAMFCFVFRATEPSRKPGGGGGWSAASSYPQSASLWLLPLQLPWVLTL